MRSLRRTLNMLIAGGLSGVVLVSAVSWWGFERAALAAGEASRAKDLIADILPPPMYLVELRLVLSEAVEGRSTPQQAREALARLKRDYAEREAHWRGAPLAGVHDVLMGAQHEEAGRLFTFAAQVVEALSAGDAAAARGALEEAHAAYLRHRTGVDATVRAATTQVQAYASAADAARRQALVGKLAVFLVSCMGLAALATWARRSVWRATGGEPSQAAAVARAVADGDLAVEVRVSAGDEHSVLAAMGRMCAQLVTMVRGVRGGAESVAIGTAQIAAGNADLSRRTEAQAGHLQHTAAEMARLAEAVKANAATAQEAARRVAGARSAADQGQAVVADVVQTMQHIASASQRIADIVGLIDGIAFRTNLLALNAAVEAARAGEQGRGFAVVASEVRTLAGRAAEAAREIRQLIGGSVEQVQAGERLAASAGEAMGGIVAEVQRVHQLMQSIEAATDAQGEGIARVAGAVGELDRSTQQNAALVEESAAAAKSLQQQADALLGAVAAFRLGAQAER